MEGLERRGSNYVQAENHCMNYFTNILICNYLEQTSKEKGCLNILKTAFYFIPI